MIDRELGDRHGEAITLFNLSLEYDNLGERAQAIAHAQAALSLCEQLEPLNAAKVQTPLDTEIKAAAEAARPSPESQSTASTCASSHRDAKRCPCHCDGQ